MAPFDRSVNFLLTLDSNYASILYRFRDDTARPIFVENRQFYQPVV